MNTFNNILLSCNEYINQAMLEYNLIPRTAIGMANKKRKGGIHYEGKRGKQRAFHGNTERNGS